MARLAVAIDAFTDIWTLADGWPVEAAIADAMVSALGADVLVYRNTEMQGAYFGVARLLQIGVSADAGTRRLAFDKIRMFSSELVYPAGVTMLTRLQYLDNGEFDAIVRQGQPVAVGQRFALGVEEGPQQPLMGQRLPDFTAVEAAARSLRRETGEVCALTGEDAGADGAATVIWPKGGEGALEANNLLFLVPDAAEAFRQGHFSIRDDFSILFDMALIEQQLLERTNPTGRLLLSTNPAFWPAAENLAFHRRFVFRLT